MEDLQKRRIQGTAIALDGNDIDTDRIIPARFLRCVTFDGLGEHAFEDDRLECQRSSQTHPFDLPERANANVLLVDANFGCGSSREHAPQALMRWNKGIKAIVGESFAEIFFGNCVVLGIPCLTATRADIAKLKTAAKDANATFTVDLEQQCVQVGDVQVPAQMPEGPRQQLVTGRWDSTAELLEGKPMVASTAANLPYFSW